MQLLTLPTAQEREPMTSHTGGSVKIKVRKVASGAPSKAIRKSSTGSSRNLFPTTFQRQFGPSIVAPHTPADASFSFASPRDPPRYGRSKPVSPGSRAVPLRRASQQLLRRVMPVVPQFELIHPLLNWRRRFRAEVWKSAFQTIAILPRNSCISIAYAWFANFCFSLDNIFSASLHNESNSNSVRDQTSGEFIIATLLWIHTFFCAMIVISQAPMLLSLRFHQFPEYMPTFIFCLRKLLKQSCRVYIGSLLLIVGILVLFRAMLPPASRRYKPEFYLSLFYNGSRR